MGIPPTDLVPQGDPETVVCLPSGTLLGLCILGVGRTPMTLGIREDMEGQPVSCVITTALALDIQRLPFQSNPRRDHGDGHDHDSL